MPCRIHKTRWSAWFKYGQIRAASLEQRISVTPKQVTATMEDIFDLNPEDFKQPEKKGAQSQFYNPDPKNAKDNVYRAVIRFLPNKANPTQSIVKKVVHWLEEGERSGFYADCPSSIGEKSIVSDTYWKLKKSSNAYEVKQAERIGYKEYFFSYVYVVKDFQDPNLNGTVQVLRYPKTIRKMIEAQLNPGAADVEMGAEPTNVFDLFNGKDFFLMVGTKSNFKNYDGCKFGEKRQPITINGVAMQRNEECKKAIMDLYSPELPALESFGYKPWSEELSQRVHAFLAQLTGSVSRPVARVTSPEAAVPTTAPVASLPASAQAPVAESSGGRSELDEWLKTM